MPTEITRESYRAALQKAVDEKGSDYVYPKHEGDDVILSCRYVEENGYPGCIHGHALSYLGYSGLPEGRSIYSILTNLSAFDDYLRGAAEESQIAQDQGKTWAEALEAYDKAMSLE